MSQAKPEHGKVTPERKCRLEREDGFQKNCTTGTLTGLWEAHHILTVQSMSMRRADYPKSPPELAQYLEDCLWVTPWDINVGKNLIGLPTSEQYRNSLGESPEDLPSHKVDHTSKRGYNDAVRGYLRDQVWNSLTAKKEVHDVDVANLKKELESASEAFREKLTDYGKRKGGTKFCWKNRFEADYKNKWYYPFSMAMHPSPRSPGIDFENLKNIFQKLKIKLF